MEPVRFGVISTARIAIEKVIPALQRARLCRVVAIASRERARAEAAAAALGIAQAYGSYAELLADPAIEAVYNPLPNHLHVPISVEAAAAGKHVLCEKPIALSAEEAVRLIAARDHAGVLIQEAFMVRHHPQSRRARELVHAGRIGELRVVQGTYGYMNRDPQNVRNQAGIGGGGLYDIGCYPIAAARFLFAAEPMRVVGQIERDPDFGTDRLASVLMAFAAGQALFVCSTQLVRATSGSRSSAPAGGSRSRSRSTRRPTGRAGSSSTTAAPSPTPRPRRRASMRSTSTRSRATRSPARSAPARRSSSRSRTRSATCA